MSKRTKVLLSHGTPFARGNSRLHRILDSQTVSDWFSSNVQEDKGTNRHTVSRPDSESGLALADTRSDRRITTSKRAATKEVQKPIAVGVLKIKAKLGELLPAEKGGRGNKVDYQVGDFAKASITAYRKIASHAELLDEYANATDDVPTQLDRKRGRWRNRGAPVQNLTQS